MRRTSPSKPEFKSSTFVSLSGSESAGGLAPQTIGERKSQNVSPVDPIDIVHDRNTALIDARHEQITQLGLDHVFDAAQAESIEIEDAIERSGDVAADLDELTGKISIGRFYRRVKMIECLPRRDTERAVKMGRHAIRQDELGPKIEP